MTAPMTIAGAIADRRRRILDRDLLAAAVDEHGVVGESDHVALAQAAHHRILTGFAGRPH